MAQSLALLTTHIIFSTKHRSPWIEHTWQPRLYEYIGGLLRNRKCALLCAGGVEDHVHLLVAIHPTTNVSDVIRDIKANSSRWVHETITTKSEFAWQSGYAAFAVSRSLTDQVSAYIRAQEEHHRTVSFQDELRAFLTRHGVEFDERYVWE